MCYFDAGMRDRRGGTILSGEARGTPRGKVLVMKVAFLVIPKNARKGGRRHEIQGVEEDQQAS